ncbi:gluconate:H+ symporter [Acidipila rosea]|uniref:Gluconate permease GntT n=1 Tax=Acidipila rosea TaxID=768535 RepID=A0A4R1L6K8_9BACT|nr:gluconate:H+ symporter [Acidipila rosea]TCK71919.1 gluconate permease GntT [Acidipila rosea]
MPVHSIYLLTAAVVSVLALVVLIARYKVNPFLALCLASFALALATRMPLHTIVPAFESGAGNTLGHIAIIVGLGTMLGKMMAESGGAERIAHTLVGVFGEKRIPWAMVLIGILVGLPVFFDVGFVLLVPIAYTVARRTRQSLIAVGLPMAAGLSVVHGLVPPHPAAMLAVAAFHADTGRTILYALIIGIPTAILAGPVYARWISPRITLDTDNPIAAQFLDQDLSHGLPGFGITLATILSPVFLMLCASWADAFSRPGSALNQSLRLLGSADVALLIGVVFAFITLGRMRGFSKETLLRWSNECLAPTAIIILLIGAGGGFGKILEASGVAAAIVDVAMHAHVPIILLAWSVAALVRLATGSATVAMTTSAGIIAPIALHLPGMHPELLAIATGAGSLVFSHVNDGGFWLVKEYLNLSVTDTFKTWSVCETIISIAGLLLSMAMSLIVR